MFEFAWIVCGLVFVVCVATLAWVLFYDDCDCLGVLGCVYVYRCLC